MAAPSAVQIILKARGLAFPFLRQLTSSCLVARPPLVFRAHACGAGPRRDVVPRRCRQRRGPQFPRRRPRNVPRRDLLYCFRDSPRIKGLNRFRRGLSLDGSGTRQKRFTFRTSLDGGAVVALPFHRLWGDRPYPSNRTRATRPGALVRCFSGPIQLARAASAEQETP